MPIIVVIGLLVGVSSPAYQEFASHSNGNASYEFAYVSQCPTGKRESGYALAPAKFVLFKQKPYQGQAGKACVGEVAQ